MVGDNYIILEGGFLKQHVMYIDMDYFLADTILAQNNINIKFEQHYSNIKYKNYTTIIATIPKSQLDTFVECMEQLKRKALIFGETDYIETCKKIIQEIVDNYKRSK
jgi:hypothetical protein